MHTSQSKETEIYIMGMAIWRLFFVGVGRAHQNATKIKT